MRVWSRSRLIFTKDVTMRRTNEEVLISRLFFTRNFTEVEKRRRKFPCTRSFLLNVIRLNFEEDFVHFSILSNYLFFLLFIRQLLDRKFPITIIATDTGMMAKFLIKWSQVKFNKKLDARMEVVNPLVALLLSFLPIE